MGTVLTMAPEVRSKNYDEKVDVWGIGMVLYMCAVCMDPWYDPNDYSAMEEDQILAALDDPNLKLNYHEKRWALKPKEGVAVCGGRCCGEHGVWLNDVENAFLVWLNDANQQPQDYETNKKHHPAKNKKAHGWSNTCSS